MATSENTVDGTARERSIPRDLTSFQRNLLLVLSDEPKYGLAIKRELEGYYGEDVNHGRLYPNLDELVDMGLIEKSQLDKRTNQYELTELGYETVQDHLEWVLEHVAEGEFADRAESVLAEYC